MIFGCCTNISNYDEIAALGYGSISLAGKDIAAMDEETFAAVRSRIAEGPLAFLSVNASFPPSVRLNGKDFDPQALEAYTEKLCQRVQCLGGKSIGVGSPNSRTVAPDFDPDTAMAQFEQAMQIVCRVAAKYDLEVGMEACCDLETNFVNTTAQALALVERLQLPNFHLVYDIYHAYMMQEDPGLVATAARHISCVHISKPQGTERYYPDEACMAIYKPYIDALLATGYQGEFSTEAFHGDFREGVRTALGVFKDYPLGG